MSSGSVVHLVNQSVMDSVQAAYSAVTVCGRASGSPPRGGCGAITNEDSPRNRPLAAEYWRRCRGVYVELRWIVGQLGGIMMLTSATSCMDINNLDPDPLGVCLQRWRDVGDQIRRLNASEAEFWHKNLIELAHCCCGDVVKALSGVRCFAELDSTFGELSGQLSRAYAWLQCASLDGAGLVMVDFSQACCAGGVARVEGHAAYSG